MHNRNIKQSKLFDRLLVKRIFSTTEILLWECRSDNEYISTSDLLNTVIDSIGHILNISIDEIRDDFN